jgi:hypothetical protein
VVQMGSVPLLALTHHWQSAAGLIILERIGKAIRNPPRDVMLSHAVKDMGYGWGFGVHEALDQFGALFGPLLVTAVLVARGDYRNAFAILLVPALIVLALLVVARWLYPRPEQFESAAQNLRARGLTREFWLYAVGAGLVAAGFVDFSLVAFHFAKGAVIAPGSVPVFYAVAMAVSGLGSLLFGKLFDRYGFSVLSFTGTTEKAHTRKVRASQSFLRLVPVLKDFDLFQGHQAIVHHFVEHRQEGVDLLFAVDDVDDQRQVHRQAHNFVRVHVA